MAKEYLLYLGRWQLSTPILALCLFLLTNCMNEFWATVIANLIGGLIFFWVDRLIFRNQKTEVKMRNQTESQLQVQVADYIRLKYPSALFHSDFGSGIKLTMGQAAKQKRQNGGRRAWPDMFIAKQRTLAHDGDKYYYAGLFLELKKDGVKIRKKNGELVADKHIREQAELLEKLRIEGYAAGFACGFDEAKKIIDEYLG